MFKTTILSLLSIFFPLHTLAQISSDGTLSTNVSTTDGQNFTIDNGKQLESNLFHSFSEFSVPTGGEAFFDNPVDAINIFSRVTGGSISNIDGLIRTANSANFFLLNPAGILFGPNASLDIGGSFIGSTADSILFPENLEFSAINSQVEPILTINAPIGLNFRDNPGDIINQSVVEGNGLQVSPGNSLILVGGRVINEGGAITALDGKIFLGGVATKSTVGLDNTFNLNFPEDSILADILINNGSSLNVRAEGRGTINLIGNNIEIFDGAIRTGVNVGLGDQEIISGAFNIKSTDTTSINNSLISTATLGVGNGGDININAAKNLNINSSNIGTGAFKLDPNILVGEAGNINIVTNLIDINNESILSTVTTGEGNAGEVNIQANSLLLDNGSIILNSTLGTGNAGNINVEVNSLSLIEGGELSSTTDGEGNAGNINVQAADSITLIGTAPVKIINGFPGGFSSGFFSSSDASSTGQGGIITVNTDRLQISNGAVLGARTKSTALGGNIIVNAKSLDITGGGQILTAAFAAGNAGNVTLNIDGEINISGSDPTFTERREQVIELFNQLELELPDPEQTIDPISPNSGIFANTVANSTGDAGSINISANSLNLTNGSINVSTNAGNQGNITLNLANNLVIRDNGLISATALNDSDGGNVNINSQFIVAFPSKSPANGNDVLADALRGRGGNIEIKTESLLGIQERTAIEGNGTNDIDASSELGLDGNVSIVTPDTNKIQTDIEALSSPIDPEQTVAQACKSDSFTGKASGLNIKGKGGIPPQSTEPLNSEIILIDESNHISNLQIHHPEIQIIKTNLGDIYPARGIIKTEEGNVILTAYTTTNLNNRTPNISANCSLIRE